MVAGPEIPLRGSRVRRDHFCICKRGENPGFARSLVARTICRTRSGSAASGACHNQLWHAGVIFRREGRLGCAPLSDDPHQCHSWRATRRWHVARAFTASAVGTARRPVPVLVRIASPTSPSAGVATLTLCDPVLRCHSRRATRQRRGAREFIASAYERARHTTPLLFPISPMGGRFETERCGNPPSSWPVRTLSLRTVRAIHANSISPWAASLR